METDKSMYLKMEFLQNLLIELIENSNECSKRYISPIKLREIYRKMCSWKELLLQMDPKKIYTARYGFNKAVKLERTLIHFQLERCYWIRYGDSDMVSDLLKKLFEVDGHLGKIFDFQQLSISPQKRKLNSCRKCFTTTWSDETISNEKIQPFQYFLEHSNKMKTLFMGQRLAEMCFVQCYHLREAILLAPPCSRTFVFPETLVTFLQYGLFANSEPDENNIGKLLTGIIGVILNSNQVNFDRHLDYTSRIIKAGNVLLRAVPCVRMSTLLKNQNLENKEIVVSYIVQEASVPNLLPQLKVRCTGLQELQHLCRITIRRALYDNWMLPQGTTLLPLPTLMKKYINLEYD